MDPGADYSRAECLVPGNFEVIKEVVPILRIFSVVTRHLSVRSVAGSDFTTVASMIPIMDALHKRLTQIKVEGTPSKAVKHGVQHGIDVLDKYYAKTNESALFQTAILLHPGYRVQYLVKQGWPTKWVEEAKEVARNIWQTTYREMYEPNEKVKPLNPRKAEIAEFNDFLGLDQDEDDSTDEDPFAKFINGPRMCLQQYKDPIIFWSSEFANTGNEQTMGLARIAMDVLGCPATSVEVERAFSRAGLVVSPKRNHLDPETAGLQLLVADWFKHGHCRPILFEQAWNKGKAREVAPKSTTPVPALRMIKGKSKGKRTVVVDLVSPEKQGPSKEASSTKVPM